MPRSRARILMPRRPRLVIAGIPLHITQRGVNRAATFLDAEDKRFYHELLVELVAFERWSVHAYALMSNHVHLMVSTTDAGDLAHAMRMLNQRYVASFNRRHRRTGTLWESRFRSCLVDSDRYLLTLYRYIELNPVRAAMVDAPEHYAWSSARANLGLRFDHCIVPHPAYLALGSTVAERTAAYRDNWLSLKKISQRFVCTSSRNEHSVVHASGQWSQERSTARWLCDRGDGRAHTC